MLATGIEPAALLTARAAMQNRFLLRNYGAIAWGFLRAPRWQRALARALVEAVAGEPRAAASALRHRQLDPLLWSLYGAYSRELHRRGP